MILGVLAMPKHDDVMQVGLPDKRTMEAGHILRILIPAVGVQLWSSKVNNPDSFDDVNTVFLKCCHGDRDADAATSWGREWGWERLPRKTSPAKSFHEVSTTAATAAAAI